MQFAKSSWSRVGVVTLAFVVALWLPACSESGPSTGSQTGGASGGTTSSGGSGGTTSSGGTTGSGGTTATGGSTAAGGGAGSGGGPGSGGRAAAGGSSAGGATTAAGGTSAAGGAAGSGGAARTGGRTGSGGVAGDGGAVASGGTTARGGATGSGGVVGSGGATSATGGTTGSGGDTGATGGTTGSGGATACAPPTVNLTGADAVADGPLVTFNTNGGWCWYQDERAVVDVKGGKIVVGSVAFPSGDINAVIYDIATNKAGSPAKLGNVGSGTQDDHNAPAFIVRPDGGYAAMWAGHNHNCLSYYSVYSGSSWSAQKTFDWASQGCPWSRQVTYSNLWYLGTDLVSFVRSIDTSPSYLVSKDNGASFSYGGRLTSTATVGYVAGYYKYWGNNTDRIDFLGTEAHPRDNNNSLYHGYVKGGQIYNSTGTVVDTTLADKTAQDITKYTKVFATGSTVGSVKLERAWNADLVRYDDGAVAAIWTARVTGTGSDDPDKRLLYARFDGSAWKLTYLAKAGTKLYADEQDYTGLGALHPDDPTTIYISTPYNPSTDTMASGAKREIWRGTTCDNGATFKWTPVTASSTKDNIRPIVPKWDAQHTALLWMRGTYTTAQSMSMSIVGTVTGPK